MAIFTFVSIFAAAIVATIWGGYVLSVLWGWFMVPIFALPALSIAQAIAVKLTVRVITYTDYTTAKKGDDEKEVWLDIIKAFFIPLVVLGLAWIIKQWV